ncbi:hypothetical protein ACFLQX_01225 [Bacteroidota bacterium]
MLKRILVGGAFAVVAAGIILVYLLTRTNTFVAAEASQAVSENAILFVDKIDYQYFTEEFIVENQVWNELKSNSESFQQYDSLFQAFSQLLDSQPVLKEVLEKEALSLSIHLMGRSELAVVFYLQPSDQHSISDLEADLTALFGDDAILNERKYEAVNLKDVSFRRESLIQSLTYGSKDDLLIVSCSSILVEDAIRNLNSRGGIYHQKGFQKVAETAGKYVHANLFVNYRILDQLFYPGFDNSKRSLLKILSGLAEWGELDADLNSDALVFNGMTFSEDSLDQILNLFNGQSAVKMESAAMIPSNITSYLWAGISDAALFGTEVEEYYRIQGKLQEFRSEDKRLAALIEVSPFRDLLEIMKDEITWFRMEASNSGEEYEVVGIEVNSRSEAISRLRSWTLNYAANKEIDHSRLISTYVLDDQTSYDIYHLPENMYDGFFMERFIKPYFAFYDRYIFFSDSKEAISRTIYQNVLHKTLDNESSYEKVSNYLSSKGNISFYMKPDRFLESISGQLTKETAMLVSKLEFFLKKIPGVVFQFVNEGEMYYSNLTLKFTSQIKEKSMTEWESMLDSVAIIKPALVTNHNTSEKEIMVQDAAYSLYLINGTGRVLWKVRLDGKIMSEIVQIDYYKNGKLQYIFNTSSGIHLIDRNGNYVERYPIKFRADATNGITLFDYDNRKEYRIFVACSDRKVYVYDIEGNILPGWNFTRSEGIVKKPIQHFKLKEKDYIVFSDPIRAYILDRRGRERVKQKELAAVSENNQLYLDMNLSGNIPRLITTDTSGNVIGLDFDGNLEQILAFKATKSHFFRIKDLDNDGTVEYIYAVDNELKVIDSEGERFFSYKIKSDIEMLPDIYQFSASDLKIGITDSDENRIHLINSDGSVYEGFPLEGNTRYSIGYFKGSDSRFNLIVGSADGFIYNYSIE